MKFLSAIIVYFFPVLLCSPVWAQCIGAGPNPSRPNQSIITEVFVTNEGSSDCTNVVFGYAANSGVDLTNTEKVDAAFQVAMAVAGTTGTIIVPPGTYWVNNSGGVLTFNNFSGTIRFEKGATLLFTDNANYMLRFHGGSPRVIGLNAAYQTPPAFVTGIYGVIFDGTQDAVLEDANIQNSGAVGLQFYDSIRPKLHNILVTNTLRGGVQITNCQNAQLDNVSTENTGDDALAFINYASDPDAAFTGASATNISIHNSLASGIKVAGQSDVLVSNFLVDGTAGDGVITLTDSQFNTSVPDRVVFSNGIVKNTGTLSPLRGNQFGLEFANVAGATFNNIQIIGSATGAGLTRGVGGAAPAGIVTLSNIRVVGAGASSTSDGFNVGAGLLHIENCISENAPGTAFYFSGAGLLKANNLTAVNASRASSSHHAYWFDGTGFSSITDLVLFDTQPAPTGYIIGGGPSQTGVLDGVIVHFVSNQIPTYSFAPGTFQDISDQHFRPSN